jgi:GntR family histidine utilization transcriptional repressor
MTLHKRIRHDVERRIFAGEWPAGFLLPTEEDLARAWGCSRMTVNKVLTELAGAGLIQRRRKAGSVVATPRAERAVLAIHDFQAEAAAAGRSYRHEILERGVVQTAPPEGPQPPAAASCALRIVVRHLIDGVPEAIEERLINLAAVPQAEHEPFATKPPGSWLLGTTPWSEAEHGVSAITADAQLAARLGVPAGAACLALQRTTWLANEWLTVARIVWPGDRQRLVERFRPVGTTQQRALA